MSDENTKNDTEQQTPVTEAGIGRRGLLKTLASIPFLGVFLLNFWKKKADDAAKKQAILEEVAKEFGVTHQAVTYHLNKAKKKRRGRKPKAKRGPQRAARRRGRRPKARKARKKRKAKRGRPPVASPKALIEALRGRIEQITKRAEKLETRARRERARASRLAKMVRTAERVSEDSLLTLGRIKKRAGKV